MADEGNFTDTGIPVLTDVVTATEARSPPPIADGETLVAELQTVLASRAFALTEEVLRTAFSEMEATLFEQITGRLRQELPELVDAVLRERLGLHEDDPQG